MVHIENPYIIGRPIRKSSNFFGRERLFEFVRDSLTQGSKIILLHGQRRIGKSSILTQIPLKVILENFVFANLSLEGKSQKKLGEVLWEIARDIRDELELSRSQLEIAAKSEFLENPDRFADEFLPHLFEILEDRNLVLLFDEFDVLVEDRPDAAAHHFFPYLNSLVRQFDRLYAIPTIGRQLSDVPTLLNLFKEAPHQEISLLDETSAERAIIEPAKGVLNYSSDAIRAVLDLTAGHPYFTQVVCFALFAQARESHSVRSPNHTRLETPILGTVTQLDVERICDRAIELGEAGLAWFRDGLPIPERVVFSAIAQLSLDNFPETQANEFRFGNQPVSREFFQVLEGMLKSIAYKIAELLNADRATIYLLDEENDELWSIVAQGEDKELRFPKNLGIAGEVAQSKEATNIQFDFYDDPRSQTAQQIERERGYRTYTMLTLPLSNNQGELVAVIQFINKLKSDRNVNAPLCEQIEKPGFSDGDTETFKGFANFLLLILESSRKFYEAIQRQRYVDKLVDALHSLGERHLSFEETLTQVMEEAKQLLNADRATVWLLDRNSKTLWTKIPRADGSLKEMQLEIGEGFAGEVAQNRQITNVSFDLYDYDGSHTAKKFDKANGYRTCSLLCMPVLNPDGELIGVTQLVNKTKPGQHYQPYHPEDWPEAPAQWRTSFTKTDIEVMESFNRRAATILQQAVFSSDRQSGKAFTVLENQGVEIVESLYRAYQRLEDWHYIHRDRVVVDIVRRWLVKNYPVSREIFELERLDKEAQHRYDRAKQLRLEGNPEAAIALYRQTLDRNPNHFHALFELAQVYLDTQQFENAVGCYRRAYRVDRVRNGEEYVRSLWEHGVQLFERGIWYDAAVQFERILSVQPGSVDAKQKLEEIQQMRVGIELAIDSQLIEPDVNRKLDRLKSSPHPDAVTLVDRLERLKAEIATSPELDEDDRAEAELQIARLAESGSDLSHPAKHKQAKTALKILKGTMVDLSERSSLWRSFQQVLPELKHHLNL
ncbi:GAF domain-containing protein [Baaleninema simplex]|uniref:GAF domain-containing protein n=1 Tax=Baaleninema simplex TaxID=2862350 RepID=UPI000347E72A|nr:GAF domain-containing protein [Baaleninema simplex]